ncbi:MAG TPA: hypothetical protein VF067_07990 [Sphingomicrobium sp.]
MRRVTTKIASIAAAAAIVITPTMASAAALPSSSAQSNAWVTLSQLNPAGATALAGSTAATATPSVALAGSAAAAQPTDDAYRPNPLPLPVIAVLLAVLGTMIYIALIEKHHRSHRPFLTSPQ